MVHAERRIIRLLGICCALLYILSSSLLAQDSLKIAQVSPFLQNDTLYCEFGVNNLFSGEIREALLSGLPILLELKPQLYNRQRQRLKESTIKLRVTYDIWEDHYLQESNDVLQIFTSLEQLIHWWQSVDSYPFFSAGQLNENDQFWIVLDLRVIVLTRRQNEKLRNWIINSAENEDDVSVFRKDSGFRLNLNRVIAFFIGDDSEVESFVARAASAPFTPGAIIER